jgi:stress response protein SCP2
MSTLHANTVETSSGGAVTLTNQSAAKMYINFNGTGTVAIRDDLNISTLVDLDIGDYQLNYATNFVDVSYVMNYGQKNETSGRVMVNGGGTNQADPTTSRSEIMAFREHSSLEGSFDPQFVYVTGYGDLA